MRSLLAVLARHAARVRSRRALLLGLGRALLVTTGAALLAAPFALAWGVGRAQVEDYLGPHQVSFATDFSGELALDLGPLGNAYLPSPAAPVGVRATVHSVGGAATSLNQLFSAETLSAYVSLYEEPELTLGAVAERLERAVLSEAVRAEAVLLLAFAGWRLRDQLLSPWVARHLTWRRAVSVYLTVVVLVVGSVLVPTRERGDRFSVSVAQGTRFADVQVDSGVLADLLSRGVSGVTLLSRRQQADVRDYVDRATAALGAQIDRLPQAQPGESLLMGFSDLHCNQAMTELMTRLAAVTAPRVLLDSGDDTVNGTAVEKTCTVRQAAIDPRVPMLVSGGNHDSDVTQDQLRAAGVTVLDGAVVEAAGLRVLGDDDPEYNVPFSVVRNPQRPETEEQLGERMVRTALPSPVDAILVHQPPAAAPIMAVGDPPARLVLWGHMHAEVGPTVVTHADGSWTVGMQQGTSGGVKTPTITSFSTPFSPPLKRADVYFYLRDDATGLITAVQPVRFEPDGEVVVSQRLPTGDLDALPDATRQRLTGGAPSPSPADTPG